MRMLLVSQLACCLMADRATSAQEGTRTQSIILVNEQHTACRIVQLADENQLDVEIDGVPRRLRFSELVAWGSRSRLQSRGALELSDGSLIAIDQIPRLARIEPAEKQARPTAGEAALEPVDGVLSLLKIPVRCVAAIHAVLPVRLGTLGKSANDRSSGGAARAGPVSDPGSSESSGVGTGPFAGSLEFQNADILSGRWVDPGLLRSDTDTRTVVHWRTPTTTLTVPWERIAAIRMQVRGAAPERIRALFGFQDGTLLAVDRWMLEGGQVRLTLACGAELRLPRETLLSEWNSLESLDDELLYLSDIEPLAYRCVPYLSLEWPLGRDRSVTGENLTLRGRVISKGLGMHATSRVAYDVSQGYGKFSAELALDGSSGEQGSVVCRIAIDKGDGEWTTPYTSAVLRGGGPGESVSIDISAARRLALIVESADHGDVADRLNWLRARLTRLPNGRPAKPASTRTEAAPGR